MRTKKTRKRSVWHASLLGLIASRAQASRNAIDLEQQDPSTFSTTTAAIQTFFLDEENQYYTIEKEVTGSNVHTSFLRPQRPSLQQDSRSQKPCFGKCLREEQFPFFLNYTNFNHGSFGAVPKSVLHYQSSLRFQQEQQPDVWFRQSYYQLQNQTRKQLASYLGLSGERNPKEIWVTTKKDTTFDLSTVTNSGTVSQADGLVLVESASTATNSILRSFSWHPGDVVLQFSVAYPMVQHTTKWLELTYNITVVTLPVSFPISTEYGDEAFLHPMRAFWEEQASTENASLVKMVILDHMVSSPAIVEPIERLAELIHSFTAGHPTDPTPKPFLLVDGAHCMGQISPLNLSKYYTNEATMIDAYVSNGHKWLYSPKGSAILWINLDSPWITSTFPEPTVISSANGIPSLPSISERYAYVSTRDYTATLSMSAALDFRASFENAVDGSGEAAIYRYCRTLALQAKQHLWQLWQIAPWQALAPDSMEVFMINVPLPPAIQSKAQGLALMDYLLTQHNIYMIILVQPITSTAAVNSATELQLKKIYYTRLSSQIYLDLDDFERLGTLVLDFCRHHL